jgi:Domain of unknown function (DUF4352)
LSDQYPPQQPWQGGQDPAQFSPQQTQHYGQQPQLGSPYQQPPWGPPQQPPRRKSWVRRHKILTAFLSVGTLFFIIIVASIASAVGNVGVHVASTSSPNSAAGGSSSSSSAAPAANSGPEVLQVGQPLTVTQDGGAGATIVIKRVRVTTQPADPEFGQAPQNGYYIIATVHVSSKTNAFDVNDLDFYAVERGQHFDNDNGNAYDAVSGSPTITSTLNSGESETGQIVFDLPHPHGTIDYAPNFQGGVLAKFRF